MRSVAKSFSKNDTRHSAVNGKFPIRHSNSFRCNLIFNVIFPRRNALHICHCVCAKRPSHEKRSRLNVLQKSLMESVGHFATVLYIFMLCSQITYLEKSKSKQESIRFISKKLQATTSMKNMVRPHFLVL